MRLDYNQSMAMNRAKQTSAYLPALWLALALMAVMLSACGSRQLQDSLTGSTAQRLVTHSIDQLAAELPASDFAPWSGQRIHLTSHFIDYPEIRAYADRRLAVELERRFDIEVVAESLAADAVLNVFYTSLGTDQGLLGVYLPLGFVPGMDQATRVNLITLEQFHGVAEMYYFIGESGTEHRGEFLRARARSDALGLPVITIPISNIDR